jgi:hypothetical protein
VPLALLEHSRQELVDASEDPKEVDSKNGIPLSQIDRLTDRSAPSDTGVVAEHMHSSEALEGRCAKTTDSLGVSDVSRHAENVIALKRCDRVLQSRLVVVRQHEARALL